MKTHFISWKKKYISGREMRKILEGILTHRLKSKRDARDEKDERGKGQPPRSAYSYRRC